MRIIPFIFILALDTAILGMGCYVAYHFIAKVW